MSQFEEGRDQLRALWLQRDPYLTCKQIGDRLGLRVSQVLGRVHRMKLPPRPSPIKRRIAEPRSAEPPRVCGTKTLPTLPALAGVAPAGSAVAAPPPKSNPAPIFAEAARCLWPTWTVKDTAYWHAMIAGEPPVCGAKVRMQVGNGGVRVQCNYCPEHTAIAVKKHDAHYASALTLRRLAEHVPTAGTVAAFDLPNG